MVVHELEVDSVLKSYGNVKILSNVYLTCKTGDVVGILGRNGCGKSTLLKIIFGSEDTYDKSIRIDKEVYAKPYQHKNLIAYLPQHDFLPKRVRLRKIAALFLEDHEARERVLLDPRIKEHLDKPITELSGGQRRYFEVLLLVNLPVKFILLDEPFSGIEPLYKDEIKELINRHRPEKGFIITDHDYSNIISASDRLLLIVDGVCKPVSRLEELEELNYLPKGTLTAEGDTELGDQATEEHPPFEADTQTLKDLDLFDPNKAGSLYSIFESPQTKGGKYKLDELLKSPVQQPRVLEARRDAIRYLQESGIRLQIDRKQVDFAEYYLTSTITSARRNYLDAALSSIRRSYKPSNDDYIIETGIKQTGGFLTYLTSLLPVLQNGSAPLYLSQLCFKVAETLAKPEIREVIQSTTNRKTLFFRTGEYDHLFRKLVKNDLLELLNILYELDAYAAVASTAEKLGFSYPDYLRKEEPEVEIKGLFHPLLDKPVANDFAIDQWHNVCFLTGANMSGKSTFLKAFGISMYLAHAGFPVPAASMKTTIFSGIITTINLADNINKGYSHFYSEVRRVRETALKIKKDKKLIVIFDELFRGTNVKDASEASLLITSAFSKINTSLFLISTHIVEIAEELKGQQNIFFSCFDTKLQQDIPVYDYQLVPGVSKESLGLYIVRKEGIVDILGEAVKEQICKVESAPLH
ncbi:ATP-binding cassette domain-containing protein [Rufibacter glacialis]|uniref:ATP-binding cassette domain-containing protein n=1 Tax=Rufibacter glacialis TaxID=1259555 RepID=A0A5M8Q706_9BACT|nr:ATP-binding cassette domain-containing protein [Rufibacter glacialis]KAA6430714.1 ATP-binding cassette domain-containing protein [Rufibacter glacialis]GGK86107.1 hypothetical protein GCM10011405_37360 [Rufibacter glacialis]